ncbi:AMP-binding protein [Hydrogenophaga sp.]|uniref:AMP-binding protein n=1 Tax=Hydrogenophaga sp. TaxID=1904254 RepID=UPI002616FDF0|nr:AMP-binding protein [Hydrogenophaga sp.]MDM7950719.1 AMP-binding protein [Hydrogenophaga sp.]
MQDSTLHATGLIRRNSLSFVRHVFALNKERQPLVSFPDEAAAKEPAGLKIERCIVPEDGGGWFTERHALIHDDLPAQVTYTSGTEGKPKGIILSYANLADAAERIISEMDLTADVREYVGVPVTHSFGMARIRVISAVGGWSYLPSRGFDPLELSRMLGAGEVNSLSAVPTLLRILLRRPEVIGEAGQKLRWMEIGSQYMSAAEKRGIREMFPNARIVQHYGLTEASRSTFLRISDAPDELLESVGCAVGKTEVGISPDGRIRVRGPHVAKWRIEGNHQQPLCEPDGWLLTSDLGHMNGSHLYFDGRADDQINSGGVKINPDLLEAQISKLLKRSEKLVVTKVPDKLRGEGVLVVAESQDLDLAQLKKASGQALKKLGLDVGDALHAKVMPSIPQTATGKPLRRILTEEFVRENEAVDRGPEGGHSVDPMAGDVMGFFQHFFPGQNIDADASFEALGGDSLGYIQFSMGFEQRFGPLPSRWESLTVAQLQSMISPASGKPFLRLESATLTRAFFMICIVALHLDTFVYSKTWGAAYFLFMLAGYSLMRFQWPEISRTGKVKTIFGTVLRIAIPTVLMVVAMQLWAHETELKPLLLISNYFDPHQYHVVYFYFAEIYMQLLLIIAGLLSFRSIRNRFQKSPLISATVLIVLSMALSSLVEWVWDTNYIYHRTPIWYLWTVACGMLIASASLRNLPIRLMVMAIVATVVLLHHGFTAASCYIWSGCALLLFWPEISVPVSVKRVVGEIAGASMFMYLSHYQVQSVVTRLFHEPRPWTALFTAVAVGIVFARTYNWIEGQVLAFGRYHGWWGRQKWRQGSNPVV